MHKLPQPVRLWYWGPYFRYERPQEGRFRQFNQIGAETIGTDEPAADAELIVLLDELLRGLGIDDVELRLSSLGTPASREAYRERLRAYLREHEAELSDDVRSRIDSNPLRAFDADHEGTRAVMAEAPTMLDALEPEDAEHLAAVRRMLDAAGVAYRLDGTLVRGLDYYTRTVFEFTCPRLGSQSGIGGGGRYDGLVEQLGGPADAGRRLGRRGRADPARDARGAARPRARRLRRRRRRRRRACLRRRPRAAPRAPGDPDGPRRALVQEPDEAGRPLAARTSP